MSKEGDQKGWWKGQIGDKVIATLIFLNLCTKKTLKCKYNKIPQFQIGFFPKVYVQELLSKLKWSSYSWLSQFISIVSDVTNCLILLQPEVENSLWGSGPNEIICNILL